MLGCALITIWSRACTSTVVGIKFSKIFCEILFVYSRVERQSWTDAPFLCRPSEAHACNRNDLFGQSKHFADGPGMITDNADRAAPESNRLRRPQKGCHDNGSIDGRIEKQVEMIVWKRLASR